MLEDSFQGFRAVDLKLQEVEPLVSTYAVVLDNWYTYCGKIYEKI